MMKYCATGVMTDVLDFSTIFHDHLVKMTRPSHIYTVRQIQVICLHTVALIQQSLNYAE